MMRLMGNIIIIITISLLAIFAFNTKADNENLVKVNLKIGSVIGEKINEQYGQLNQFLGIPYATPPTGNERFQRSRHLDQLPNEKPYEALQWPKNCYQPHNLFSNETDFLNPEFSDDCLYLNIWSPDVYVEDESKLRPVIVYIHGGSLIFGSSTSKLHNGQMLSTLTDSVVVTINYRLSTFGLLYSDQIESIKGNNALWDQVMALEWIQDNIKHFGGNPSLVTLIGESAGAISVSAHILSPVSRNLFKNAYMMSGAITFNVLTPEEAVQNWLTAFRKVNCASDSDFQITQQLIDCLSKMSRQEQVEIIQHTNILTHLVIDGEFFPENPFNMLRKGNYKKPLNLLISTMENEGSSFLKIILQSPDVETFYDHHPKPIELSMAKNYVEKIAKMFIKQNVSTDILNKIYFNGINPNFDDQDLFRRTVGIAFGDFFLTCPTLEFGKAVYLGDRANSKVYQLYNTYKLGSVKPFCNKWAGSCHADDLIPLFGVPFQDPSKYLHREREISYELLTILKSFIKNGHPNQIEQPEWQNFFIDEQTEQVIMPYYTLANQHRTYQNYQFNLKQVECEFWKKYYSKF